MIDFITLLDPAFEAITRETPAQAWLRQAVANLKAYDDTHCADCGEPLDDDFLCMGCPSRPQDHER